MFRINPREMEKLMKQMGMNVENVEAEEVIIKCRDKEIVVKEPVVQKINLQGVVSFQVQGIIEERGITSFSDEDVSLVMAQADVSEEEARKVLEQTKGDIAEAILILKGEGS